MGTDVAMRLRTARLGKRLTQTELAVAAGVAESSVRAWETGVRQPTERHAFAVCAVLDINPAWLLLGEIAAQIAECM